MLDPMAGALAHLGTQRAFLVCGEDGLDEVSLSGPTLVREVRGHTLRSHEWTPRDFGLEPCTLADLYVTGPEQSASLIRALLDNRPGPAFRIVIANAAAALLAAERVVALTEGVAQATEVLRSGRARQVLEALVTCSQN
jgi:anthranilate phosphoribosyltransferase